MEREYPLGCTVAQRLVMALTGHGIDYKVLCDIVYPELRAIALEQKIGDWLEFPGGATYTKTFQMEGAKK